ncbi:MAG: DNA primase [Bacteroidia bacterium]
MIPKDTIDKIIDASRVEEVIGDFITLKKRGANLLGLCPFHGEKTPSFTVSPAKGIYKCFGCGKAGNSVNFIMDHESLTYPEALRYLAKKYNIEVVEKEISPEEKAQINEKESLYIVASYAQKYFTENLHTTDEGKSIGLSYFKERGFRPDIIEKFQLGYSFEARRAFSEAAVKAGYKPEYLVKAGLSILSDKHVEGEEIKVTDIFDRYTSRVIFPIHNVTGRVIGFGGRILGNDKKLAKYINSPQTDIYDKSKVLYGLYFAKKTIIQEDNCYLVEGYTDVTSMHQAGIENVVASSGTSLTVDQIKLIHRFTSNITILYDGDFAGIKASFRGIDLILEEGMNVRVLLFPDGDDPDSFSKKVNTEELKEFIKNNSKDFITFKTNLLYDEAKHDPIKKATLIKEIVESISLIPDSIHRSVYVKECSRLMDIEEQVLNIEVNKIRRHKADKRSQSAEKAGTAVSAQEIAEQEILEEKRELLLHEQFEQQEKNIIRLMMLYGKLLVEVDAHDNEGEEITYELSVAEYIIFELVHDQLSFVDPIYQMVYEEFVHQMSEDRIPDQQYFLHHPNPAISQVAINLVAQNYELSDNWTKKYNIHVGKETDNIKKTIEHDLFIYKDKRLHELIKEQRELLKTVSNDEDLTDIIITIKGLETLKQRVNKLLGRTVIR